MSNEENESPAVNRMLTDKANEISRILTGLPVGHGMDIIISVLHSLIHQMGSDENKQHACGLVNREMMKIIMGEEALEELESQVQGVISDVVESVTDAPKDKSKLH